MPDTAGSPGHQFRLTAREVGLCDESSHAGNKRDPKAAESTALGGRRVCVSARVPSRPWRPATAPGLAPFNRAAKSPGAAPIVKLLLEHGASPNPTKNPATESSPIIEAASAGDAQSMQLLIDRGADIKAAGETALGLAAAANCSKCVALV